MKTNCKSVKTPARTETAYIEVIDTKTKTGPDTQRNVSLGMNHELRPGVLNLLGNLPHNSEITLDKTNARKLIAWLQVNVVDVEKRSGKALQDASLKEFDPHHNKA